ncbi:GNAT family N-acetyltransferase [Bacillus sp. APMAM]|nr:GNAT family N-acetyltransferase [Bacillus sp. APMAM]RTZ57259.1 GNAT family N-acetyltransferase [Bacillus sp. SAJ1]
MKIRIGTIEDIKGLARVHYESWKTTYSGIFSEETLTNRTYEKVLSNWRPRLENRNEKYQCFLAETEEGEIVAFAECGVERTNNFQIEGELYTLYILESFQRKGIGTLLFKKVIEHLSNHNIHSVMAWVIKDNESRKFYERHGGEVIGEQLIGDTGILEVAYAWKNLNDFI